MTRDHHEEAADAIARSFREAEEAQAAFASATTSVPEEKEPAQEPSEEARRWLENLIQASQDTTFTVKLTIDRDRALAMVERNTRNRPLYRRTVERYGGDLTEGMWKYNKETLKFAKTGRMLDGQHRLAAVVLTGVPLVTDVIFGLDEDVIDTLDTGRMRKTSDVLSLSGFDRYPQDLVAACRVLVDYQRRVRGEQDTRQGRELSAQAVEHMLRAHPGIARSVELGRSLTIQRYVPLSIITVVHYLASLKHPEKADDFIRKIATGADMEERHPVLQLRNALIRQKGSKTRLTKPEILAKTIRAWNAFLKGRSLHYLRGKVEGRSGEEKMPELET